MDFSLNQEQEQLVETVRRFAQAELLDEARRIEDEDEPASHAIVKRYAEFGLLGVNITEELGGGMSHLDAARLLLYRAVINAQKGLPSVADSSIAKCFSNEMVREVTGKALQLMGGYGYSKEFPVEQKLRDGWGWGIAGRAIDIQKTNFAAALAGRRFDQRR